MPNVCVQLTYQLEDHLIHYVRQNGVTVLVMADAELPRRIAFGFLNELHRRFLKSYSQEDIADAEPLGMTSFNKQIGDLMEQFTNNPPPDPVRAAQDEISGVKQIMTQNIEAILSRGERIELLVDKTDNLGNQAAQFRKRSQALRRKMWWKNTKLIALTAFVVVVSCTSMSPCQAEWLTILCFLRFSYSYSFQVLVAIKSLQKSFTCCRFLVSIAYFI